MADRFDAAGPPTSRSRGSAGTSSPSCARREPIAPETVARTLLDSLVEPFVVDQERLHLSGSAGIAMAPEHGTTVGACSSAPTSRCTQQRTARLALVYRSDIDVNDPSLLSLMGELREGMASGDVDIEVEPVVDLFTGAVISAEALVRWHHPTAASCAPGCSSRSPNATG